MREPEQLDLLDWLAALPPIAASAAPQLAPSPTSKGSEPSPVHLTRVDPSCNMRRFYSLALTTSLFGECGVTRQWGRLGSEGRRRTEWYLEPSEARRALEALLRAKRRRGYTT
ncbi:WGR domain-containing protein [Rubellimicrobium rubrum]|uniref:WGR domain-containing protein n=1 Tax=Rubellimicrobium rubrum TaxID=2585369 RepID=A0A5C4MQU1_9RHOB|nr:WGR domain-containing protein [Rubellimicrobium rubrum]TNC46697.1 WGR domain-containing protein [Rubellimicrobium rubrum]